MHLITCINQVIEQMILDYREFFVLNIELLLHTLWCLATYRTIGHLVQCRFSIICLGCFHGSLDRDLVIVVVLHVRRTDALMRAR